MELHYTNLLIVVAVGFAAPLVLGFAPKLRMPSVVLELVAGILVGPSVLGWVHVDPPVAVPEGSPGNDGPVAGVRTQRHDVRGARATGHLLRAQLVGLA